MLVSISQVMQFVGAEDRTSQPVWLWEQSAGCGMLDQGVHESCIRSVFVVLLMHLILVVLLIFVKPKIGQLLSQEQLRILFADRDPHWLKEVNTSVIDAEINDICRQFPSHPFAVFLTQ